MTRAGLIETSCPARGALVVSAVSLIQAGDLTAAEMACRKALAVAPNYRDALEVLGVVLQLQARYAEAEAAFADLTRLEPRLPTHWINLGAARQGLKCFDEALAAFAHAAALGAASADFFFNVGITHLDRLDYEAARAVLGRARALAPRDAVICLRYAQACYRGLNNDEAMEAMANWPALEGWTADLLAEVAQLLVLLGQSTEAETTLRAALGASDLSPAGVLTVLETLERSNRVSEAEALLMRVESSDSRSAAVDADVLRARAKFATRRGDHETAYRLYSQLLQTVRDFHLRHIELYPLARALDGLGRHAEAYATLIEAHASQLACLKLAAPAETLRGAPPMTIADFGCEPEDVRAWDECGAPSVADSPMFIVAFPRSGTTLLEITLDSHPSVKSMDEQPFIQNALDAMIEAGVAYPGELRRLTAAQLDLMRSRYWERARHVVELRPGERLVDKNPLNMLRLPVIRRLFPNSRIVLAIRHPCDVLLSCFMQHFRAPEFSLRCQTLRRLAYTYRRSFDFWYTQVSALEPAVREVRYETLVTTFEQEVRSLANFLELPWDAAMLEPAEHARRKGYISTPSYTQVVEPVSAKSVGRWQHYTDQFAEVLPTLEPYLQRWGYAIGASPATSANSR